jgi:hypothetical protein
MAVYGKYLYFVSALSDKLIDVLGATDTFKAIIHTDATTLAVTTTNISASTQIGGSNGYTTGGNTLTYTCSNTAGTVTMLPTDTVWTASGGALGASSTGRYFTVYDDTATTDIPVAQFDYGATFTVNTGETMTLDFDAVALFQLA